MTYLRIRRRVPTNKQLVEQQDAHRYNVTFQNGVHVLRFYLQPVKIFTEKWRADAECRRLQGH